MMYLDPSGRRRRRHEADGVVITQVRRDKGGAAGHHTDRYRDARYCHPDKCGSEMGIFRHHTTTLGSDTIQETAHVKELTST